MSENCYSCDVEVAGEPYVPFVIVPMGIFCLECAEEMRRDDDRVY